MAERHDPQGPGLQPEDRRPLGDSSHQRSTGRESYSHRGKKVLSQSRHHPYQRSHAGMHDHQQSGSERGGIQDHTECFQSGRNTLEYLTMSGQFSTVVSNLANTVDPGHFTQKLHETDLISSDVLQRAIFMGSTPRERICQVILAVLAQIELRASVYHQFISVLRNFNPVLADILSKSCGGSQVNSGKSTLEYYTMSKHVSVVVHSLAATVDPVTFAQKLQEAGLIGSDITGKASVMRLTLAERIYPVIQAILAQTELQASVFHQFISVLWGFNSLLADVLRKAFDIERKQLSTPDSTSTATQPHSFTKSVDTATADQTFMHLETGSNPALSRTPPQLLTTSGGTHQPHLVPGSLSPRIATVNPEMVDAGDMHQTHSVPGSLSPGIATVNPATDQEMVDTGDIHQSHSVPGSLSPGIATVNPSTYQEVVDTGDIHQPHSVPGSLSPEIATVNPFTDQEMIDTGKIHQSHSVPGSLSPGIATVNPSTYQEVVDTGDIHQPRSVPGSLSPSRIATVNPSTYQEVVDTGDIHQPRSVPGSLSPGIATVNPSTDQEMIDTGNIHQSHSVPGSLSPGIATVNPSTYQEVVDTGGTHQPHSIPGSLSPRIATVNPSTDQEVGDTGNIHQSHSVPGSLSPGIATVNPSTYQEVVDTGDIHQPRSVPGSLFPGIATVNPSTDQETVDTGKLHHSVPGSLSPGIVTVNPATDQDTGILLQPKQSPGFIPSEIATVSSSIPQQRVDPGMFALKLQEVGLVGSDITQRAIAIGLTLTERIRPVIQAILAQTELQASVFHQFISVLRSFNPLLADALNKAIVAGDLRQPLSYFGFLCQETSILNPPVRDSGDQHLSQPSPLTVPAQPLPSRARTDTSPAQRRAITGAVDRQDLAVTESNLLTIKKKFRHLKIHVRKKLENKQTDPVEFYESIIDLYSCHVTDGNAFVIQILGPASEATLRTMFLALTLHRLWDFMNYHLLGGVISEFACDDNDLKMELKDYEKDLTGYELVTKIPTHLDVLKYNPTLSPEAELNPEPFAKLSIKVDAQISEHSLVYVIDLWESLAHHCRLPLPILLLHEVAEGCISIALKIPAILAPHVASKARELKDFYDNSHIQLVMLDGSTIYSAPQAELTPMTAEAQKDDQEDIPSPGGEHGGPAESAEIIKEPDMLPEFLREHLQTIALYRNLNMLYLHMDSPSVLPKLLQNEIIDAGKAELLQFYTHRCAQNMKFIHALYNISFTSEVVLKFGEALETTAGQVTLGKKLLADFRHVLVTHPLQHPQYIPGAQPSDLHEVTDEFVLTLHHVVSAFDQMSGALQSLKMILGSLVLPCKNGEVMPLVEPQAYEHSHTVQELFGCLSNYYNPVSIGLLQALTELSGCVEAEQKLSEYATTLGSKNHLLCVRQLATGDKQNDLNAPSANQVISTGHKLAHEASLDKLQSLHPVVFSHLQSGPKPATRITVEIDKQAIFLSDYNDILLAVCAMFEIPPLALVYIGCSTEPLVLAWCTDILSYVGESCSPTVGRMLAEQKVTGIAFGDRQYKCLSLMEVEYFEACTYGLVEEIPKLLQAGVSVNVTVLGDSGLLQAARRGKCEVVKFLLRAGAYPDQQYDADGMSPLLCAIQDGREDIAQLLLDAKADPNLSEETHGESPLIMASRKDHESIVQLLIDAGADVNFQKEDGVSPLLCAADKGHEDIVQLLLDAKANPNLPDKILGESPLIKGSCKGHESIVQLLIDAGADVNYQREDGTSSLMFAAQDGHEGILQLLLKAGANPNLQNKGRDNPLMLASFIGHQRVVELLLENGADVNILTKDGSTALMLAAYCGHHRVVELLLENGADLNHQNMNGQTALTAATAKGHQRVVDFLRNRADLNPQRIPDITMMMEQLALQMSMQGIPEQQQHHEEATETTGSSQSAELDISVMTEEEQLALALQMSMQGLPEQQHDNVATETTGWSQSAEALDKHRRTHSQIQSAVLRKERELDYLREENAQLLNHQGTHKHDPTYPRVCFFGDPLQESVDSSGRLIQWPQVGVELDIPPGAVPSGEVLYLSIWPCLSGPYVLPAGWELASPVYLIKTSNFHFKKPVKLSITHIARLSTDEDCDKMAFISSRFSPQFTGRNQEYHFRVLDNGHFREGENVGTISVTHFCAPGIAQKLEAKVPSQWRKAYSLLLYHNKSIPYKRDGYAVFAVSLCHPLYMENLRKDIKEQFHGIEFWLSQKHPVQMTDESVGVEYPQAVGGWRIKPDRIPLLISQKEVNLPVSHPELSCLKEHYPPRILLTITSPQEAEESNCALRVFGVSEPVEFHMQLKREKQPESSAHKASQPSPHPGTTLGERPTLRMLLAFPAKEKKLNIPELIGTMYTQLGIFLLEDDMGTKVRAFRTQHQDDAETINIEILTEWINGRGKQPVIWKTLVEVLRNIRLNNLADSIAAVKSCE